MTVTAVLNQKYIAGHSQWSSTCGPREPQSGPWDLRDIGNKKSTVQNDTLKKQYIINNATLVYNNLWMLNTPL